jgi:hypothetical protein
MKPFPAGSKVAFRRWNSQGKRLWLPSQNGLFAECLQPHQATFFCSAMSTLIGAKPVPLCEPSQNG